MTNPTLPLAWAALAAAPLAFSQDLVPVDYFELPEGLEATVWASSPQLRNPTNMDVDKDGRIWVAEGVNYRYNANRDPAGDRITVIEDTDGDGKADKSWTFVQDPELLAPLGVAVIDNQIFVSNAPDLIVYTDVDRDLRFDPEVDKREVLLTGFYGKNHDHALHSVTFGPDGRLYFNQGNTGAYVTDKSGQTFRVGSVYDGGWVTGAGPLNGIPAPTFSGEKSDDGHVYVGGAGFRMEEDGTDMEVFGFGFRNSYEQAVNSFGEIFQNDNDDPPACRTSHVIEYGNTGYFSRDGKRDWRADIRPGQDIPTAQWRQDDPGVIPAGDVYGAGAPTGIAYYENGALGEKWRGLLLSCESARNVVFGYQPSIDGAGYALDRFNFLTSNPDGKITGADSVQGKTSSEINMSFRPSDVVVGADGALYVADWFDPRVGGHADHDKTTSGAIYRIAPKGFVPQVPEIDLETTAGQIAALSNPAVNVRALGYKALLAGGDKSVTALEEMLADENPYLAARALWLLSRLGDSGIELAKTYLSGENEMLAITAVKALRRAGADVASIGLEIVANATPAVRRELALALRDLDYKQAKPLLIALAKAYPAGDRAYLEAWGIGATHKEEKLASDLAKTFAAGEATAWPTAYSELVWRLHAQDSAADLAARASAASLSEEQRLQALTGLAFIDTTEAADLLFDLTQNNDKVGETARWWLTYFRKERWLEADVEKRLAEAGIYDASKIVVSGTTIPKPNPENAVSADAVAALTGNPKTGAAKVGACYACHKLEGTGVDYAPDLTGWAQRQSTSSLITAIVAPSADIAHGYDGMEVLLKNGTRVHGVIDSHGDPLVMRSMGGLKQIIPQEQIERINWLGRSPMLTADQMGLTAQDVADIVAYLQNQD